MPINYSKWDNLEERATIAQLEQAPDLEVGDLDASSEAWVGTWEEMTMAQRMVTLALFWNEQEHDARVQSVKRLITILRAAGGLDAALEARFKGGHAMLRSLDTSVYAAEKRPKAWVAAFSGMGCDEQVALLARCFDLCDAHERGLVIASFV